MTVNGTLGNVQPLRYLLACQMHLTAHHETHPALWRHIPDTLAHDVGYLARVILDPHIADVIVRILDRIQEFLIHLMLPDTIADFVPCHSEEIGVQRIHGRKIASPLPDLQKDILCKVISVNTAEEHRADEFTDFCVIPREKLLIGIFPAFGEPRQKIFV